MRQQQGSEVSERRPVRRLAMVMAAVAAVCALFAGAAQASVISIGSVLPKEFDSDQIRTGADALQHRSARARGDPRLAGERRDRALAGAGCEGGPFYLRVLHPNGKGGYEAAGTSQGATPTDKGLQTFNTNLKVKAGDLIGIDPTSDEDKIGVADVVRRQLRVDLPDAVRRLGRPAERNDRRQRDRAQPPKSSRSRKSPRSRRPSARSTGGTVVTITGKNFNRRAKSNSAARRRGFTVDSDTEITATTPRALRPGKVDVTVTTFAGDQPQHPVRRLRLHRVRRADNQEPHAESGEKAAEAPRLQARPRKESRSAEAEKGRQGAQAEPEARARSWRPARGSASSWASQAQA